jgi:phosphatidylglycerophosphatase A
MTKAALCIATWFGSGYSPKGPGTAGSLAAILVLYVASLFYSFAPWHAALLALLLFPLGVWASTVVSLHAGKEDPQIVVVDEVVGQWIALGAAPVFDWKWTLAAFVLFRIFDIVKPWPASRLERLPRGWGILMDDVAAGLYAALVLAGVRWLNQ